MSGLMRGLARPRTLRAAGFVVLLGVALPGLLGVSALPAAAVSTAFATVDMPFDGVFAKVSGAHPSVHHITHGGDWSVDLYARPGTDVRLLGHSAPAAAQYTVASRGLTCPGGGGGSWLRLNVTVGTTPVGWIEYQHLDGVTAAMGATVAPGAVLGKTRLWDFAAGCWEVSNNEGVHTHVEVSGLSGDSCYTDRAVGFQLQAGKPVGYVGGGFGTGTRSRCPIMYLRPQDYDTRVSTWNEYGPAFEGNDQIATLGATHTHAYGRSVGQLSYNFDAPARTDLRGLVRITARLSSELPFYSAPPTATSDVVLLVNGVQAGAAKVIADNGSGQEYSFLVNAIRIPNGPNRIAFAVDNHSTPRNGICIYQKALVTGAFDAAVEVDFTLKPEFLFLA